MKHLLNDLTEFDKNSIREQHKGGIEINNYNFRQLVNNKLGTVKPFIVEQDNPQTQTLVNKVASEGLKNITPQMVSSDPFDGEYSGYVFGGTFNNTEYKWDCMHVEGMSGVRGFIKGLIFTETVEVVSKSINQEITDAKPSSLCVGFYKKNGSSFVIYTSKNGKPKCMNF